LRRPKQFDGSTPLLYDRSTPLTKLTVRQRSTGGVLAKTGVWKISAAKPQTWNQLPTDVTRTPPLLTEHDAHLTVIFLDNPSSTDVKFPGRSSTVS